MHTTVTLTPTATIMEFDVQVGTGVTLGDRIGQVRQTGPGAFEGITRRGFWEAYANLDDAVRGVLFPVVGETDPIIVFGQRD